jgi:hypothetical protein
MDTPREFIRNRILAAFHDVEAYIPHEANEKIDELVDLVLDHPQNASDEEPEEVTQEIVNQYLVALRDSGKINMFGAAPYVVKQFGIDTKTAREMTAHWMENFKGD